MGEKHRSLAGNKGFSVAELSHFKETEISGLGVCFYQFWFLSLHLFFRFNLHRSLVVDSPYPKISNSTEFQPTEEQSGGLTEEEAGFSQAQTPMIHRSEESLAIVECVDPIVAVYPEGRRECSRLFC
ncbi:hypothetical protein DM860_009154 [Cuscuta australis]|uniref:Uncharacterized protein n=1 Tax=Cuscuta australis TaxID=267555 RepID=A0A328DA08_9ASTE|nr:hypothetical protein DM860_009154 [Cuscuta australis]